MNDSTKSIHIASWNVDGIKARHDDLLRLVADYQPSVICLQKTRTADVPEVGGYRHAKCCNDRWSGVATYWLEDFTPTVVEADTHRMVLDFGQFVLINAYVPYSDPRHRALSSCVRNGTTGL